MPSNAVGEQFYVTHCTMADSVLNDPGYTVRATSSNNRAALQASFRYPPYELPIEMWRDLPQVSGAPRRLALTENPEDPDEKQWVVHSTYLAKDTVGRDRSYFSHLVRVDSADPVAVLRSWNADGWVKSYDTGSPKTLPGNFRVPEGKAVSDAAVTAFLGDHPPGPTELGATVCPQRLRGSAQARRDVFSRVLQALVLLDAEQSEQRQRLYIHAEPGVVALLLYGACRLLPADVTEGLTFSTFEPYHRNIRNYKMAAVVGTYLGSPDKGLEPDLGTTRGIALDTVKPACSSAKLNGPLQAVLAPGLSDLIDLAARGEWNLLPAVHRAMGRDADGLPRAGKAILRARGLAKVDEGKATVDELLAIREGDSGADELAARADKVWPVVKAAALLPQRGDVRRAFADLLADPDRVKEVWEEAVDAILKEDFRKWDARWAQLREVPGREEAKKLLKKFVGNEKNEERLSRLSTDVRGKMRAACADVAMLPPRPLLVPVGLGELEPLLAAPPDWAGYTAFVLLANDRLGWIAHVPAGDRAAMRKRAREFLFAAPAPAVAAYVHAARPYLDTDPGFLEALFKPYSPAAAALMDKLLTTTTLEPGDWLKLRDHIGLTRDQWGDWLLEKDRLANFLVGLGGDGTGAEVWDDYLGLLTNGLVSPALITTADGTDPQVVHDWERKVHGHLKTAADRLTAGGHRLAAALPRGGVPKLFAANNLLKWVDRPATAEKDGPEEVKHACETFEIDRLNLVRVAYKKGGYDRLDLPADLPRLEPIIQLFTACYPVDSQFHTARSAVSQWLKLSQDCPQKTRAVFQAQFVLKVVPDTHYGPLLDEQRQHPFEPYAVTTIRQAMAQPKRPAAAAKYNSPAARTSTPAARQSAEDVGLADEAEPIAEEADEADDQPYAVQQPSRAGRARGGAGRKKAGKQNGGNAKIIAGVVVGAVVVMGAIGLVAMSGSKSDSGKSDQAKKDDPPRKVEPSKPPELPKKDPPKVDPPEVDPPKKDPPKVDPPMPEPKTAKPWKPEDWRAVLALTAPSPTKPLKPVAVKPKSLAQELAGAFGDPFRFVKSSDPKPPEPNAAPDEALKKGQAIVPKVTNKLPHLRLWH